MKGKKKKVTPPPPHPKKTIKTRENGESCRISREVGCGCLSKEGLVGRGKVRDIRGGGASEQKSICGVCVCE